MRGAGHSRPSRPPRPPRLSGEERRDEILRIGRRIFAERGFHGATTRELALAAGVSEALLFKYFPNKRALYKAMLASCKRTPSGEEMARILQLTPSTSTLMLMIHHFFDKIHLRNPESADVARLLGRSLNDDGQFARVLLDHFDETWIRKFRACIKAAKKCGDLDSRQSNTTAGGWLCHHLLLALMLVQMPREPVVNYRVSKSELHQQAVRFALRGLGYSEATIREHYNPEALALLTAQ